MSECPVCHGTGETVIMLTSLPPQEKRVPCHMCRTPSPVVSDEVVERLRKLANDQREKRGSMLDYGTPDPELLEAADLIVSLKADNERMKEGFDRIIAIGSNNDQYDAEEAWQEMERIARTILQEVSR